MSHRVVIVGGGFGGLHAALSLRRAPVDVTLVDRRNFHLFQPLLYQTATAGLSPADIATPIRYLLRKQQNVRVVMDEVLRLDPQARKLVTKNGELPYDSLVLAAGVTNHYFGHEDWAPLAPGLKSIEDAISIRRRILRAFEAAEAEPDPARRAQLLTFVVIGGGATGVELAGAVGELAHYTLQGEFRSIDPRASRVLLVEASDRILPELAPSLSERARRSLNRLGVEVETNTRALGLDAEGLDLVRQGRTERIPARTVLWAAGVRATSLGDALKDATGCPVDAIGRIQVEPDLSVPGHPEIFAIGDMAHVVYRGGPIACVAPAAIQQGRFVARVISARLTGKAPPAAFSYFDKGSLATIGRLAAVGEFRGLRFWGFPAWLAWLFIHLLYLVEFENRLLVLVQWVNMYVNRRRGARLITEGS
ncbi:MAG: NAD(P)/FAD-dependent oxidoreductase [Longimicrobiales bacterium]